MWQGHLNFHCGNWGSVKTFAHILRDQHPQNIISQARVGGRVLAGKCQTWDREEPWPAPGVSEEPVIGTCLSQQGFLEMESVSWPLATLLRDAEGALACVLMGDQGGLLGAEGACGCLRTDRLPGLMSLKNRLSVPDGPLRKSRS